MGLATSESDAWDDFSHPIIGESVNNRRVYENYKIFRDQFKKLSRRELIEKGWLESDDDKASEAVLFFALNADRRQILFRKSTSEEDVRANIWLSLVRARAEFAAASWEMPRFRPLTKGDLREIAKLSARVSVIKELPRVLSRYGVILVYLQGLPGMKLDGAAFSLPSGHMVIGMSLRFGRLDYFWFTLMHEMAHLALHQDLMEQPVIVDIESQQEDDREKAANKLAKNSFVERGSWRNCPPRYESGSEVVVAYAREQQVHPAIIAGLLRRELDNYARYSDIISQYDVRVLISG